MQGVALRDRDEVLGAGQVIAASPVADFGDLFGEKRPKRVHALGRAIRPTAYRYVLNLVIAEAGIAEGISPLSFVVADPGRPLLGDNAVAVLIGPPDDDARCVVSLLANAPAPGDGENLDDMLASLRPRLLARLEEVMPFASEHTLLVHSPNQARPAEGVASPPKLPVHPPEPLWTSSLEPCLGIGALPHDLGVKGVTTACSQNLPGLGLEGAFAAGWSAARLVCTASGKKKDYLKDEVLLGT